MEVNREERHIPAGLTPEEAAAFAIARADEIFAEERSRFLNNVRAGLAEDIDDLDADTLDAALAYADVVWQVEREALVGRMRDVLMRVAMRPASSE